ncbi:MAG: hypothetical protein KAS32_10280, partial [Candidatus Peribacteraceae bacterium]|nr:hypothetical protein [Candidatus Peribacteraceae bacterium]
SVYTPDNVRMHPSEYELVDSDNCIIEFSEPTIGYVVLVNVGDLSIEDFLDELEDLITSVTWIAYKHDVFGVREQVGSGDNVETYSDDNFYYFDIKIDKSDTYIINEIDVFDKNGGVLFHSLMSDLYKQPGTDMTFHYRLEIPTGT